VEKLGLPARQEVAERYARQTGLDLSELVWYQAFASWKTVIALQQLYMRYVRGESSDERMASRGDRVAPLAERTLRLLQQMPN
jgi:aminoglycoside phosphotransferase (APT) family kinase protein